MVVLLTGANFKPLTDGLNQPSIRLTTGKHAEKRPVRLVENWQLGNIHYVDMATSRHVESISLSIQVSLGTLGTPGVTLAQCRYLSSWRTNEFPTPGNFESNLSVRGLVWSAKNATPKSFVNFPVTIVQRSIVSIAKTLGFNHLQFTEGGERRTFRWGPRIPS